METDQSRTFLGEAIKSRTFLGEAIKSLMDLYIESKSNRLPLHAYSKMEEGFQALTSQNTTYIKDNLDANLNRLLELNVLIENKVEVFVIKGYRLKYENRRLKLYLVSDEDKTLDSNKKIHSIRLGKLHGKRLMGTVFADVTFTPVKPIEFIDVKLHVSNAS